MIDPANLTKDLGGKWYRYYGTAPCPICQPQRRRDQNALSIRIDGERLLMHCKKLGCDFRDLIVAAGIEPGTVSLDPVAVADAQREREAEEARKLRLARDLWNKAEFIRDTPGDEYLMKGRQITIPCPPSLRWMAETVHPLTGKKASAIVADVSTGGVHRTFFELGTARRVARNAKMMLGPCQGGAVRLIHSKGPLVVAEGIETALSLACGLLSGPASVWAALSTSGMKGLKLPDQVGELIVATDGDGPGQAAGCDLASRAHAVGWKVRLLPAPRGRDWNDVLMTKGAAE